MIAIFWKKDIQVLEDNIKAGGFESIDQLLARKINGKNPGVVNIARVLVANIIRQYEHNHNFAEDSVEYDDDWYTFIFNRIVGNDIGDFIDSNIHFITYNYDRSLEYLLLGRDSSKYDMLGSAYRLEESKSLSITNKWNVKLGHRSLQNKQFLEE